MKHEKTTLVHIKVFGKDGGATHELQTVKIPQDKSKFRHRNSFLQLGVKE